MTQIPFSSLPLPASLLQSLAQLGYENTTDIQASALPLILEGRDLIAQAPTGSGKTAAFGLGLLAPLNPRFFGCQSLVLSPTRELAAQIAGTAPQATINGIAVDFVLSRVLYGVCYIADWASARSLVWFFGMGCIIALFVGVAG